MRTPQPLSYLLLALLALGTDVSAHAQSASDYPNRSIRVIVPVRG